MKRLLRIYSRNSITSFAIDKTGNPIEPTKTTWKTIFMSIPSATTKISRDVSYSETCFGHMESPSTVLRIRAYYLPGSLPGSKRTKFSEKQS